jgi:hypothetical protein
MGSLLSTVARDLRARGLSFRRPEVDGYQRMSECVNLNGKRFITRTRAEAVIRNVLQICHLELRTKIMRIHPSGPVDLRVTLFYFHKF